MFGEPRARDLGRGGVCGMTVHDFPLGEGRVAARSALSDDVIIERLDRIAESFLRDETRTASVEHARARAYALRGVDPVGSQRERLIGLAFAAEAAASTALSPFARATNLRDFAAATGAAIGVRPEVAAFEIASVAIRDPRLYALPPQLAVEAELEILRLVPGVDVASVWTRDADGRIRCLGRVGETELAGADRYALELLADARTPRDAASDVITLPVFVYARARAALVCGLEPEAGELVRLVASEAAAALVPILEKDALLEQNASREEAITGSLERRLVRLALDLHDGPLQDVNALLSELRLLRAQTPDLARRESSRALLLGRFDDLEARLVALESELRGIARSVDGAQVATRPLRDVVREQVRALDASGDIRASVDLDGELDTLTASQRIALIRILQEALANVREHSGARNVGVSLVHRRGYVDLEIVDDGCGFDVERTLVHAARNGRLGLVGMSERVRLLGGSFDVQSEPGGPTTISATLAEWRGDAADDAGAASGRMALHEQT